MSQASKTRELIRYVPHQKRLAKRLGLWFIEDITVSPVKKKKYRVHLINGRHVDYGLYGMEDYLQHKDKERRKRFHDRWKNNPHINDIYSPVFYITRLNW
jgi:hypothetical protein